MTLAAFGLGCVVGAVASLVGVLWLLVGAVLWFAQSEWFQLIREAFDRYHASLTMNLVQQRSEDFARAGLDPADLGPLHWPGWPTERH